MAPAKKVILPTKERALFSRLLNEYETKKPKLGLKTAESILKKFPDHAETLSMKGLLLSTNFGKKVEGMDLAKKGLMKDLTSFICWHVLGILHRADKNFIEAIKCYQQGLRIEPTNMQILRESCTLSTQLRDYSTLIELRLTLMRMQPHLRTSWISLAVAHHLAGSNQQALRILGEFEGVVRDAPPRSFDHSETILYHASILEEEKDWKGLINLIDSKKEDEVLDRKSWDEIKGRCLIELGEKPKAENIFLGLLKRNGEGRSYLEGFLRCRGVEIDSTSPEAKENAGKCFSELQNKFPKSTAAKRLALQYLPFDSSDFKTQLQSYILNAFQKGIPSIFSDLKPLYQDSQKLKLIEEIVSRFIEEWKPSTLTSLTEGASEEEPPSSLLWALYFLSQHYSKTSNPKKALETISLAISHSPTMPELSMTKARILKRAGDIKGAKDLMEEARLLDGQDRFLNCKTAKYCLRAGEIEEANRLIGLFTRPDATSPVEDLLEMQAFWYLREEALAWEKEGNWAMALKRLGQIEKTFDDMYDDQLDFHSYCVRLMTLRSYVDTMRFEDQLRSQEAYFQAALQAIRILARLHDDPSLKKSATKVEPDNSTLSEEARKAQQKSKKAAKKAEEAAKAAAAKQAEAVKAKPAEDESEQNSPPKDEDPTGVKALENLERPLEWAERLLVVLGQRADKRIETWLASFEVGIRQKNWLLCARALSHAYALDSSNPILHVQIIRFKSSVPDISSSPDSIREALSKALSIVYPEESLSLEQFNSTYPQKHANSAAHILASAKGLREIRGESGNEEAAQLILQCTRPENQPSLEILIESKNFLNSISTSHLDSFNSQASNLYPYSNEFSTKEKLEQESQLRKSERAKWDEIPDTDGTGVQEA